ncbi:MAG: tetratricopeptide repeat protein [Saprospiraceae bacterium]|nr:tetratricopeptide repeat protein [Saprospiraceae bacterium]HRG33623.1 tetratricopeptide repeat protein [Saprospiraceae bacterium]
MTHKYVKFLIKYNSIVLLLVMFSCKVKNVADPNKSNSIDLNSILQVTQLIDQNPTSDSLYIKRAQLYLESQQIDSAISDAKKSIELNSKNPKYYYFLSDAYILALDSKNALTVMDSAILLFPDDLETLLKKTRLQLILKQYMNGLATLDRLFLLDPQNAYGYYLAGHIFYETGDTGRAINSYQKATDNDPELREAWIQLGDVMSIRKNPLSIRYYDNALKLDSNDIETLHNKAFALQSLDRQKEAIQQYLSNVKSFPEYELSYYNLGLYYQSLDSIDQAITYLTHSIRLNPNEPTTYYQRGKCYLTLKNKIKAKIDFEQALRINPDYVEVKNELAQLK